MRIANLSSTRGMLITPVTLWLGSLSPPVRHMTSALASNRLVSGLLVMMRRVPACAAAPNSVPCGPAKASVRWISIMRMSGCEPLVAVSGISSR